MGRWNSSPHPISDIRDWSEAGKLEIRPDFQRREVWSIQAKIMLMDTILKHIPMPKVFLESNVRDGSTYRKVIDGQQRISAILSFIRDGFSLEAPYEGKYRGKFFSELEPEIQNDFLSYTIDFNEAYNLSDDEVREVYARVNKYTVALNKQELRRADFPGDFLKAAEGLAGHPFFDEAKIFNAANRRRYLDVEYTSELLAAMLGGIQDKKDKLDDFYLEYADWEDSYRLEVIKRFKNILSQINEVFDSSYDFDISKTRFRQKADFYSLFLVINEFLIDGYSITNNKKQALIEDLKILDLHIRPESEIEVCREYAIKCVSQANSASSRRWRHTFLKALMCPTFTNKLPEGEGVDLLYRLQEDLCVDHSGMCPSPVFDCPVCEGEITGVFDDCLLAWPARQSVKQLEDAFWIHAECALTADEFIVMPRNDSSKHQGDGEDSE